jgi:ribosomal protein S18 acetylase RimI-like enzyme
MLQGTCAHDYLFIKLNKMREAVHIKEVSNLENVPYDLLLLADPSKKNIDNYLSKSSLYVAQCSDEIIGCYVLCPKDNDTVELMNIAVPQLHQNKGFGTMLLQDAFEKSKAKRFKKIRVGTGNSSLGQLHLYKKAGFEIIEVLPDFFRENYDEPIFENGVECRDMIVLMRDL